jgi:1-aminocyclopropane-1-carboxylate deaminase
MELPDLKKITTDEIRDSFLQNKNVQFDALRLDKIHPLISGNKWFKLKYHLDNFNAGNYNGIISFGGAWSNHIMATACACYLKKIKCIGIIRGERPEHLSNTLLEAVNYEMDLKFISRESYAEKTSNEFVANIKKEFPGHYIIPEGGAGKEGEKGAGEILQYADEKNYTHIACAVGTGTMLNGIRETASGNQIILGIVALKGWKAENETKNTEMFLNYHFGGYAKYNLTLINFMNEFFRLTNIPTDFVYTGKLAFALFDLLKKDHFAPGSKILMIHSGGLQGNDSLQKGSLIF